MNQEHATNPALSQLTQWLRQRHDQVLQAETKALHYLDEGDATSHNACMRQKAELLSTMAEDAKPMLEFLPGELRFNLPWLWKSFPPAPVWPYGSIPSSTWAPCSTRTTT